MNGDGIAIDHINATCSPSKQERRIERPVRQQVIDITVPDDRSAVGALLPTKE